LASLFHYGFCKLSLQSLFRVLCLLNDWLNNEHVIFDHDILVEMSEFLAFVNRRESEGLDKLVFEIWRGIREKVRTHALP
jgi:hypothetical protein